jgi:hypothetical protein
MGRSGCGICQADTSKVVAPLVSLKDRWVGPHDQVLNAPITCRWYGPDKSSSRLSTEAWLFPTTLLAVMGEKLGTGPWIGQPVCCGLCQKPFFSGAVNLLKSVDDCAKGYHIRGQPVGSIRQAYVDWRGKCMCHVGRVFPCRVYIDLNHRDSRIWVTACLWQSSRR